jgi:phosphopantetheinyl transferase
METSAAALRVWSIKEAVAKALGIALADAWERVEVLSLGEAQSNLILEDGQQYVAHHADLDGHLVSLVVMGKA